MESLTAINDFVTSAAKRFGLDEDDAFAVQMAVDEAATNVIEHAYAGRSDGTIDISCELVGDRLVVRIHDHGLAFDPRAVLPSEATVPMGECDERCLGLYLMHKLMDSVDFNFDAVKGNTLTMVKRRHGAKPAVCV
jgi:serine/threonine-protein kinase RsbW